MLRTKLILISIAILVLVCPQMLMAQEDLVAPTLLDFTASPVVFDTGTGAVSVAFCTTAEDNLSGLSQAVFRVFCPGLVACFPGGSSRSTNANFDGSLIDTACVNFVIEQFSLYGTYILFVNVQDVGGMFRSQAGYEIKGC